MNIYNYLKDKQIVFKPTGLLFDLPWYSTKEGLCPACGRKLYKPLTKNIMFCKSKKCGYYLQSKKRFVTKIKA